jgi:hypothetical protein
MEAPGVAGRKLRASAIRIAATQRRLRRGLRSRARVFPNRPGAELFGQQSRQAFAAVCGTADTVVLDAQAQGRRTAQDRSNRAAAVGRKRVLQGIGDQLVDDDAERNRLLRRQQPVLGVDRHRDRAHLAQRVAQRATKLLGMLPKRPQPALTRYGVTATVVVVSFIVLGAPGDQSGPRSRRCDSWQNLCAHQPLRQAHRPQ